MRGRTITLEVSEKRGKVAKTIPLYQYDYGQKVLITGITLPDYYEVHFSTEMHGSAVTVIGDSTGADIPDSLLEVGDPIYLWVFLHETGDDGETEYAGVIPIIKKAEPTDITPTPEEQSQITEIIAKLNTVVGEVEEKVADAEDAKDAAVAAQAAAEAAQESTEGIVDDVNAAKDAATAAQAAAETAQSAAETAQSAAESAASTAGTAANTATGAKNDAAASATSASSSATSASSSATSAGNAKTAAENAQTAAETAQTAAETAQGKAEDAQSAAENAETAAEGSALIAEGYAVGKQNGEDVASGSGYYHNNAKYYAEQAAAAIADVIDDTAGEGDTDVTWSADKLADEFGDVLTAIQGKPDIKESNKTGVSLDLSDSDGNVLARFANGHIKTELFDSEKMNPHIIEVAANGSIRSAVETAQEAGASADNPFVIKIAPGTYDILSEFTSEEISAEGFVGLTITDGITLEGMGVLRDEVVLTATMDTSTYDQTTRNHVSTLNIKGNSGLKNLTVKANNIRYAVHDDMSFSSTKPKIRRCENCRFFATNTTSGGYGNISYGAGTDGRKVFLFKDCDFGDAVHIHTNTNGQSNIAILENCRAFAFTATDYASSVDNHYYFFGCVFNWIRVEKGSNWVSQHLFIHGNVKGAMVEGWEGMLYETGDTVQYLQYTALSAKKAVAMKNSGRYHLQLATGADDCIGIIYYYDSTNNIAYVQHGGWICAELLGFASPTIGYYLNVASDGTLSLDATDISAIGKVVCENTTGAHFIRLSI